MPAWPDTLPQYFLQSGFRRKPLPNATTIDTESGEPLSRLRFTGDQSSVTGSIMVDTDGLATFRNFWKYDLAQGTLRFTWDDPATGEAAEFLFSDTPEETCISAMIWQVMMPLIMFA